MKELVHVFFHSQVLIFKIKKQKEEIVTTVEVYGTNSILALKNEMLSVPMSDTHIRGGQVEGLGPHK